jgi:hypothetical protein
MAKATATVTAPTTPVFNTIHIFGFGTAQAIKKDENVQTPITNVQAQVDACVANIWSKKPADFTGTQDYHAINIFEGLHCSWLGKGKDDNFRVDYSELDATLFNDLATAVFATATPPIIAP